MILRMILDFENFLFPWLNKSETYSNAFVFVYLFREDVLLKTYNPPEILHILYIKCLLAH